MCMIGAVRGQLVQESVVAWRTWIVLGDHLTSMRRPGSIVWATALKHADRRPTARNQNGIWAFRFFRSAARYRRRRTVKTVIGQVRLSGTVIKHTGGYRASRCEILALVDQPYLASRYGVKNLDSKDL